jgi:penicillin-binding protein 2
MACGLVTVLAILASHLYRMQVVEGAMYREQARQNTISRESMPALRGRIFDRKGRLLVTNSPSYRLMVVPGDLKNPAATARDLARVLHVDRNRLLQRLQRLRSEAPLDPFKLSDHLDDTELARLAEIQLQTPGLSVETRPRRAYPQGYMAAHVLGYVGEVSEEELRRMRRSGYAAGDGIGKAGLDRRYETELRGHKGVRFVAVDPAGRPARVAGVQRPVPGLNLHLTLDSNVQRTAEAALQNTLDSLAKKNGERSGGAVVVMDARTGALRALASLPQYDPGLFDGPRRDHEYARLLQDHLTPLIGRAWQGAWSPGSTFKIINASASLQEKLCTPRSTFFCGGSYKGSNCFVRSGHGTISFSDSLALSCDVTYYRLGDLLGIKRLDRYAAAFGLGRPSGVDLPAEEAGILPSPSWKERFLRDRWYGGDTINMSIGQGFLVVTPLQMAVYTAAVANGGRVLQPYVVDHFSTFQGRISRRPHPRVRRRVPVAPRLLEAVRRGMRGAVEHGTATAANLTQVAVAGKTGTVENVPTVDNRKGRNHVWFTCFAPFAHPQVVVVVFLEKAGGYGGSYAAPVAREVLEAIYPSKEEP